MATYSHAIFPGFSDIYWGDVNLSFVSALNESLLFSNSDGSWTRFYGSGLQLISDGVGGFELAGDISSIERGFDQGQDALLSIWIENISYSASSLESHLGKPFVEVLKELLVGSDEINGNGAPDILKGFSGDDFVRGYGGDDTLDGGSGADTMQGGPDGDTYIVDDAGDVVDESGFGSDGLDTVRSSRSFDLGSPTQVLGVLENLTLLGVGNIDGTGNSSDNVLVGNGGSNHLDGGEGADEIHGGPGSDTLFGGDGIDLLFGDSGTDVAVYSGDRSEFAIFSEATSRTVGEITDESNLDTLQSIEKIQFDDGSLVFDIDSDNLSFAYRIYAAAYGRTPDEAGLRFWTDILDDRGNGPPDAGDKEYVAGFFLTADEYIDLYGSNPTNEQYINALYLNVLHREADQAGYDFWLGVIRSGWGRDDLLISFTDSGENLRNTAPDLDDGVWVL